MSDIQGFDQALVILSIVYLAGIKKNADRLTKPFDLNGLAFAIARQKNRCRHRGFVLQSIDELFAHDRIAAKFAGGFFKTRRQIDRGPDNRRGNGFALADIANHGRPEIKPHPDFKRRIPVCRVDCLPFCDLRNNGLGGAKRVGGRMFKIVKGRKARHHRIANIFFDNTAIGPDLRCRDLVKLIEEPHDFLWIAFFGKA